MSMWERPVVEGPVVYLEMISVGYQKEETQREVGGRVGVGSKKEDIW